MSQNVTLVNTHYPLDYLALTGISQPQPVDPRNFWASEEQLAPASDYLIFDLGRSRAVNFIDFEISGKPIDFVIEYFNGTNWLSVTDDPNFENEHSIIYTASNSNPWIYVEYHFTTVTTQQVRITFTRRSDPFPFQDSDPFPYSIEVKNTRLMNLIDSEDEFVADTGEDILGNAYRTDIVSYSAANLFDLSWTISANLTTSGNEVTDATRAQTLTTTSSGQMMDGLISDSSFGVRRAATNLFRRGQCDTTSDSIAATAGTTVAVDTTTIAPFSPQSLKITGDGLAANQGVDCRSNTGQAAAQGTIGITSIYFKGVSGQSYVIGALWHNTDTTDTFGASTTFTATGSWQLISPAAVNVASGKTGDFLAIRARINGTRAESFWIAHAMLERGQTVVAPYVATSGGSTATHAAGRVQAPSTVFTATQGWIAARVRMGYPSSTVPNSWTTVFRWGSGASDYLTLFYDGSNWSAGRAKTGSGAFFANSPTYTSIVGNLVTVVMQWDASKVYVSVNGAPFTSANASAIPTLSDSLFDIGNENNTHQFDGEVLWFATGNGNLVDADAALIHSQVSTGDYFPTFIPGLSAINTVMPFQTVAYYTPSDNSDTIWKSQPNPSPQAVEALYVDLRQGTHPGIQSYLDQWEHSDLDTRSQADMELYYSDGVVIDEIYTDPITFGPLMHIYYSLDDTPDWDKKLWIPFNRHYTLKQGFHTLPTSTYVKYIKIEFTNLTPRPYSVPEYPNLAPIIYRKYPTWVQNYFQNSQVQVVNPSAFIDPFDRVTIEPLELGFTRPNDMLNSGFDTRNAPSVTETTQELQDFIQSVVATQKSNTAAQTAVEDQIQFNPPSIYQSDLTQQLDTTRALTRIAVQGESSWNAEATPAAVTPPSVQSVSDLSTAQVEKQAPLMWFPFACRHTYQLLKSNRPKKIAYYVGLKALSFHRRDYTVAADEDYYIETFSDVQNVNSNDFTLNEWRYIITP